MIPLLLLACTTGADSASPADSADSATPSGDTDSADTAGGGDPHDSGGDTSIGQEPCGDDGTFAVAPARWDYGAVEVGGTAEKAFELCNATDHLVELTGESSSAPGVFAAGYPSAVVLPAGAMVVFRVGFTPAAAENYTGTVRLETDVEGTLEVTLTGSGAPGGS